MSYTLLGRQNGRGEEVTFIEFVNHIFIWTAIGYGDRPPVRTDSIAIYLGLSRTLQPMVEQVTGPRGHQG